MWSEFLLDGFLILLVVAIGWAASTSLLGKQTIMHRVLLGFPLGAGLLSWFIFLASWIGLPLRGPVILLIGIAVAVGFSGPTLIRKRASLSNQGESEGLMPQLSPRYRLFLLILMGLFLLSLGLAIGRSYSTWDAMAIWSIKGYGIAGGESVFAARTWGAFGLSYPLNIPLQIGAFRIIEGDQLPGSKAIFPIFFISLLLGVYRFLRTWRVRENIAIIAVLMIASTPIIFEHSTRGYTNLPFATYLVLGILYALDGFLNKKKSVQRTSGVLLGLASWTRPEGILILPFIFIAGALSNRWSKRGNIFWVDWVLPIAMVIVPWLIFASLHARASTILSTLKTAAGLISSGQFNLDAFYRTGRFMVHQLLRPTVWGILFFVSFPLVLLNRKKVRPQSSPEAFACLLMGIAAGTAIVFHFYMVSFLGTLTSWLGTSANRLFLPSMILLAIWVILLSGQESPQAEGRRAVPRGDNGPPPL